MPAAVPEKNSTLSRRRVAQIFRRHRGAQAMVLRRMEEAAPTSPQVSKWLSGRMTSARIAEACTRLAVEILEQEKRGGDPLVIPLRTGPKPAKAA